MLHEDLQADVVREDRLPCSRTRGRTIHTRGHVRRRRVELREQETRLTATLAADDVSLNRKVEPVREEVLSCAVNVRPNYNPFEGTSES